MTPLHRRVVKLEGFGRNGWRAYAGRPAGQVHDGALLGYLGEKMGWPDGYDPTDDELRAIASREQSPADDEGKP